MPRIWPLKTHQTRHYGALLGKRDGMKMFALFRATYRHLYTHTHTHVHYINFKTAASVGNGKCMVHTNTGSQDVVDCRALFQNTDKMCFSSTSVCL